MEASVSEIHRYPLRPEGFEEPLFSTRESRLAVIDHLLRTSWLSRASEMEERGGQAAHARWEPVELENRHGRVRITWALGRRRCRKRRHVVEVLGRWREVRAWWDETRAKNRSLARLLLSDGSVVDLARENGGEWFLVGVMD
jgi:integrase